MIPVPCQRIRIGGTVSGSTISDGTSIQTAGIFVSTLTGLMGHPGRRGGNSAIPYLDGQLRRSRKFSRPRQLTLTVEVRDRDSVGAITYGEGRGRHWEENMDTLLRLLDGAGESVIIERDMSTGDTRWIEAEMLVGAAFAQGFRGGTHQTYVAVFPLEAAYPYWQTELQNTIAFGGGFTPIGNATLANPVLSFTGNGRVTHNQTSDYIEISGGSGFGTPILVDVGARSVTQGGADRSNRLIHNRPWWMRLASGVAATFTTTATGNLLHRGQWL